MPPNAHPIDAHIKALIKREGGFVNHPADRGGPTHHGITQATLGAWRATDATVFDVQTLTKDEAFEIYYKKYYQSPCIDELPLNIQPLLLDMAVNHGPKNAVMMLQDVLTDAGFKTGPIDGVCGQKTQAAARLYCRQIGEPRLINQLVDRRKQFFLAIVRRAPSQQAFIAGWLDRAEEFRIPPQANS